MREAAVLAMGLSGRSDAFDDLGALLRNTRDGRKLVGRAEVGDRVRAFAAYALGLLADRSMSAPLKNKVLGSFVVVLQDKRIRDREVLTAVLNGMRLLGGDATQGGAHKLVRWTATAALAKYLKRRFKSQMAGVQSHALTALAPLVGRGDGVEQQRAKKFVLGVRGRRSKQDSAMIAMGEILRPEDEVCCAAMDKCINRPPDSLVPKFGMIAYGRIGGDASLSRLSCAFRKGKRDAQAWAALGLGLLAFHAGDRPAVHKGNTQRKPRPAAARRADVAKILRTGLASNHNRDLRAALAIGLGLAGCRAAAPELRGLVEKYESLEAFSGPLCVSLAMLNDKPSIRIIRDAMGNIERPVLFGQAGLALAKFDQRDALALAVGVLQRGGVLRPGFQQRLAAAAQAIGYLRNAKDVPALTGILDRCRRTDYPAAALGSVADRDPIGFGARVAHGMNYTARAQTISNGRNGILDIF